MHSVSATIAVAVGVTAIVIVASDQVAEVRTVKATAVVIADCFGQVRFLCSFVALNFAVPSQSYAARQAIAVAEIDVAIATLPRAINEHEH